MVTGTLRTEEFHRDPYPVYEVLRDEHPVFHDTARDTYVLTRFDDVAEAARDHERFSSHDEHPDVFDRMTRMDPPRHDQWRRLTSDRFRPRSVARSESTVRAVTSELLDRAGRRAVVDVVGELAAPVPSTVIGDLIGVPREYNRRFQELSEVSIAGTPAEADAANREVYAMFEPLIEARRLEPRDDIISTLVVARVDGRPLSHQQVLGYCLHLVVAGNDTTANLIATGVKLLADHPEARGRLIEHPALIPQAVEEMVRYDGPVQMLPRTAAQPVELHGTTIPRGAPVELYWGAANRDERAFTRPDAFDIERTNLRHLGFGHGVHFCLGAHLARLEARVVFEELLGRFPDYRLVTGQELAIKPGWAIRGLRRLLVELR
jgi:cytochrome P450 family 130